MDGAYFLQNMPPPSLSLSRFHFPFRFLSPLFLRLGWGVVGGRMEAVLGNLAVLLFFLVLVGSRLIALTNQAQKAKGSQGNTNPFGRGESNITQDFRECSFFPIICSSLCVQTVASPPPPSPLLFLIYLFFYMCNGVWHCWAIYHILSILELICYTILIHVLFNKI